jgi:benzoyl-CoA reductase/2-hydroxyglutaryl-CoA dehydratase subunit BcrC/BadD/HgdB
MDSTITIEREGSRTPIKHTPASRPSADRTLRKSRALRLFDDIVRKSIELDKKARSETYARALAEGRPVVNAIVFGWFPLMRACDSLPGGANIFQYPDPRKAITIAEDYFQVPPEQCNIPKLRIGIQHLRETKAQQDPRYKRERIAYFGGGCEPEGMAWELIRAEGNEVYVVEPLTAFGMDPARRDEYVKFYAEEARKLAIWMTGKPADEDRLWQEIKYANATMRRFREMMVLRRHNPFFVPLVDARKISRAGSHRQLASEYNAAMDLLMEELREVQREPAPFHVPLLLVGVMHCEDLYPTIDQTVGTVVSGFIPDLYREDLPPLESLGDYVLEMQLQGQMHDKCGGVVSLRRKRIDRELEEWKAKGVIIGGTTGCPYMALAREMEYEYFTKKGVPVLMLDGTPDNQEPATEEQKMRLKAFIEMMI